MLVYLQLDWIKCTPGFVVCASGLFPGEDKTHNYKQDPKFSSWLESIYKTRNTQIPSTIFWYYMLNLTDLNTHQVLLFVLLGYFPDPDKIQIQINQQNWKIASCLGKYKLHIHILASIFAAKLNQMHTWLRCLFFWAMLLTRTRYKTINQTKFPSPD